MICEIDGWVLGAAQFGVLVHVLFGVLFEVLVTTGAFLQYSWQGASCRGSSFYQRRESDLQDCWRGARGGAVEGSGDAGVCAGALLQD